MAEGAVVASDACLLLILHFRPEPVIQESIASKLPEIVNVTELLEEPGELM